LSLYVTAPKERRPELPPELFHAERLDHQNPDRLALRLARVGCEWRRKQAGAYGMEEVAAIH
jgi:hypothetical protein